MTEKNLTQAYNNNKDAILNAQKRAGVSIKDCYQCGKCTASCPMAHAMDIMPRQVIRYMQLGLWDEALHAKAPWVCASCQTCSARCPHEVDIAALMEEVKQEAKARNIVPIREVDLFNRLFMKTVDFFGRSHEVMLIGLYNFLSRHLMQDVVTAPFLYFTGKIRLRPHLVKDRNSVRRLIHNSLKGGDKA